jgi:hypothetical protein
MNKLFKIVSLSLATILIVGYWQFSNPQIAWAFCIGNTATVLNSSTYSANVGQTISVVASGWTNTCVVKLYYFSGGSYIVIPSSSSNLDCNGTTDCSTGKSGGPPITFTIKCEAAGTYNIEGNNITFYTNPSTVTCSGGTVSPIPNEVQIRNVNLIIKNLNMVIKQP